MDRNTWRPSVSYPGTCQATIAALRAVKHCLKDVIATGGRLALGPQQFALSITLHVIFFPERQCASKKRSWVLH